MSAPDGCRLAASTRALGPPHAKTRPPLRKPTPPPSPCQLEPQPELHLGGKGALDGLEAKMQEPAQQHFFSKHDNRTSFDKGIGRRKDLERLWQRHTFLRWAPCELEFRQQRPLESSYQANFQPGPGLSDLPQRLVHFVKIQPPYASTTYQQNFCQPSRGGHCGSINVQPQTPVTNTLPNLPGIPRPKLLQHYLHTGVSECLNWSRSLNKNG